MCMCTLAARAVLELAAQRRNMAYQNFCHVYIYSQWTRECLMQAYKEWASEASSLLVYIYIYNSRTDVQFMWGSLRLTPINFMIKNRNNINTKLSRAHGRKLDFLLFGQITSILEAHIHYNKFLFAANVMHACTESIYYYTTFALKSLPIANWSAACQASICTPAKTMVIASVTAEFSVSSASLLFASSSCCGSRIGIKLC